MTGLVATTLVASHPVMVRCRIPKHPVRYFFGSGQSAAAVRCLVGALSVAIDCHRQERYSNPDFCWLKPESQGGLGCTADSEKLLVRLGSRLLDRQVVAETGFRQDAGCPPSATVEPHRFVFGELQFRESVLPVPESDRPAKATWKFGLLEFGFRWRHLR